EFETVEVAFSNNENYTKIMRFGNDDLKNKMSYYYEQAIKNLLNRKKMIKNNRKNKVADSFLLIGMIILFFGILGIWVAVETRLGNCLRFSGSLFFIGIISIIIRSIIKPK
ncbi:MAG: hypothetical protein IJ583_07335, partial [Firmicutes bacterium]|nr:hypothetical protein [Bacillota bacterium]